MTQEQHWRAGERPRTEVDARKRIESKRAESDRAWPHNSRQV
jgi:hypothetical protein